MKHTYIHMHSKTETTLFCLKISSYKKFSRTNTTNGQGETAWSIITIHTVDYLPRDCMAEI